MQIDAAVLVIVIRLWRTVCVCKSYTARVGTDHGRIIPGVSALTAIGCWPMSFLEFGGVRVGQPTMPIGRHCRLQIKIVAKRKAERQLVMVRSRIQPH